MENKRTNKILISVIVVLSVVIAAMAVMIIVYIVGESQSQKISHNPVNETTMEVEESTSVPETTEKQTETKMNVTEAEYGTGMYLVQGTNVDEVVQEDGGTMLELEKVYNGVVTFNVTTIQSAPSSRIANIKIKNLRLDKNGVGKFKFNDDGWGNRGTGTIAFKGNEKVKINIKITRRSQDAMWNIAEGTEEYEYREDQKVPKLW